MCSPSNSDEMLAVLSRIKVWKAACSNGLLPGIVECCGGPLLDLILSLFGTVWSEKQIPVEWCDATLVPVSQRGDLFVCETGEVSVYWM